MIHQRDFSAAITGQEMHLIHGELLFTPGMPITHLFLLRKGGIILNNPHHPNHYTRMGKDELLGLRDFLRYGIWQQAAVAHGPCVALALPAARLTRALNAAPSSHRELLQKLAE